MTYKFVVIMTPPILSVLSNLLAEGHLPLVTKPTRITATSHTLLDQITSFASNNIPEVNILVSSISDHFPTVSVNFMDILSSRPSKQIFRRKFSKSSDDKFIKSLNDMDWSPLYNEKCPRAAFNILHENLNSSFDAAFPLISCKKIDVMFPNPLG